MNISGKRILLVEDDPIIAMLETRYLTDYGIKVHTCYTGESTVAHIENDADFDLILMDIDLGAGIDGTETAKQVLMKHDIPIIFLSSHIEKEVVEKTEDITSYGYIVKNSGQTVLISSIKMALKLHNATTAIIEKMNETRLMLDNLKQFINFAPAAVAMFDTDMNYLAVSRQFIIDYNIKTNDIIGKSHYDIFPEIPEAWKEIHKRCLAGKTELCEIDEFYRSDGTKDYVRWEIHPWYLASGKIGGIILSSMVINRILEKYRDLLN